MLASRVDPDASQRHRLLVIDDEPGFLTFVRRVGEAHGFQTFVTSDAQLFEERIRNWDASVVMIDLNMPGSDGVEILRYLAKAGSTAQIVIASGTDAKVLSVVEGLAVERGLSLAATLTKPIRAQVLSETLERLKGLAAPLQPKAYPALQPNALSEAIRQDELLLEYQPKLDLHSGQILGVEALVRWRHASLGLVPPSDFIPMAENSGLIGELTRWIFAQGVRQAAQWRRGGLAIDIAVNLSAHDLHMLELPDWMAATCNDVGLPSGAVTLEITETAAMSDVVRSKDVLARFRLKGFSLSIDDFGTGYSSLAHVRQFPYSEIKIDRSFVAPMLENDDCRAIVEAVVGLGRRLGLKVVAEGVETAELIATLKALGADAAQGYAIARPTSAAKMPALVGAYKRSGAA